MVTGFVADYASELEILMKECLYPVIASAAEKVERGGMLRFKVKLVSDDGAQTID